MPLSGSGQQQINVASVQYYWNPDAMDYVVATGAGSGVGSEVEVTNTVSVSALPAGTNNIGDVDVATLPTHSTVTTAAQSSVGTTAGELLDANSSRKRFMVQNTGTTVIKLVLGSGTPTQTAYHVALSAGIAADDGKGAVYVDDSWTGAVQAISSAASGTCVVTEVT